MTHEVSDGIPDLWPEYVTFTNVLTPLAILRFQASQLRRKTKNILEGEIVSEQREQDQVYHHLDLIAPALDRYRYRLLSASHNPQDVYPVAVQWFDHDEEVSSQEELTSKLQQIFENASTRSLIQSLFARSNEANQEELQTNTFKENGNGQNQENPSV